MIAFTMVLPPEVEEKAKADIERMRKRILKEKDATRAAIIVLRFQRSILEELDERALEWANAWATMNKPDIRIVAAPLAWLRYFQCMLHGLMPTSKKRKPKKAKARR